VYDRELLLRGSKRSAVLHLWDVQRYGNDSASRFYLPELADFREHQGAFKNEAVGFGLHAVSGNLSWQ